MLAQLYKTMKTKKITFGLIVTLILTVGICQAELRILFSSDHNENNYELYSMATNGLDVTRITTTSDDELSPAISPNNIDVAFVSNRNSISNIFITSVYGIAPLRLENTKAALCVQFATTNTIYFLTKTGFGSAPPFQLWKINTDSTGETQVYSDDFKCWMMGTQDFSINQSNQNVYLSSYVNDSSPSRIQYGGIDDATITGTLTYDSGLVDRYAAEVSPDASRITFCADYGSGNHRLYSDNATPGGANANLICETYCGNPSWIDNNSIVFTRAESSTSGMSSYVGDIWRVNFDGSELTKLTSLDSCAYPTVFNLVPEPCLFIIYNLLIFICYRKKCNQNL